MTVTLDIGPELEMELRDEAAKEGLDPDGFILNTVKDRLHRSRRAATPLSSAETALLETINLRWPSETQRRFERLVTRRRANKITPEERAELVSLTDESERQAAERVRAASELAQLRGIAFDAMWSQLGSNP